MKRKRNDNDWRGKKALIIGDHPHAQATVTYLGLQTTGIGLAMRFKNESTEEEFFVFDNKNIQWIKP